MKKKSKPPTESDKLTGWRQIADFLAQPVSVAQRWAKSGMPVEKRGRYITSSRAALNGWLGRESGGEPIQIATKDADLGSELKRALSYARKHGRSAA